MCKFNYFYPFSHYNLTTFLLIPKITLLKYHPLLTLQNLGKTGTILFSAGATAFLRPPEVSLPVPLFFLNKNIIFQTHRLSFYVAAVILLFDFVTFWNIQLGF